MHFHKKYINYIADKMLLTVQGRVYLFYLHAGQSLLITGDSSICISEQDFKNGDYSALPSTSMNHPYYDISIDSIRISCDLELGFSDEHMVDFGACLFLRSQCHLYTFWGGRPNSVAYYLIYYYDQKALSRKYFSSFYIWRGFIGWIILFIYFFCYLVLRILEAVLILFYSSPEFQIKICSTS